MERLVAIFRPLHPKTIGIAALLFAGAVSQPSAAATYEQFESEIWRVAVDSPIENADVFPSANGSYQKNHYDATGRLLSRANFERVELPGHAPLLIRNHTIFIGENVYDEFSLQRIHTPNGYIKNNTIYYFIKDYQGNVVAITSGAQYPTSATIYYPYGSPTSEMFDSGFDISKYSGKEWITRANQQLYNFCARLYDPSALRFTTPDPLASGTPWLSPYLYCAANPIRNTDPTGLSTNVIPLGDGKYKVVGGNLNDNDLGVYCGHYENKEFIRDIRIGRTLHMKSFTNDNDEWVNAIINLSDNSGINFISMFKNTPMSLGHYMFQARSNKIYDFKVTNGEVGVFYSSEIDRYRGMPMYEKSGTLSIGSARDVGNFVAGYMCAINGLNWGVVRAAFDSYQNKNLFKNPTNLINEFKVEPECSRNAQLSGWEYGRNQLGSMHSTISAINTLFWITNPFSIIADIFHN